MLAAKESVEIQQAILPVFLATTDGHLEAVGTCWIFATAGRDALAFSATHVFDYIANLEGRHSPSAASMPDILRPLKPPPIQLQFTRLMSLYRASPTEGYAIDIVKVFKDGLHDLALCHLRMPDDVRSDLVFERKLELATAPVEVGRRIQVCGYSKLEETVVSQGTSEAAAFATLVPEVRFTASEVVEVHPVGRPRGPPGPSFEVPTDSPHGMSGGPVLLLDHQPHAVACGVVSRGNSFEGEGRTIVSMLWPAYAFEIDTLRDENGVQIALSNLVRTGHVLDHSNGPEHYQMVGANPEGGYHIRWKP